MVAYFRLEEEGHNIALTQHVFQFGGAIGGVDRCQHQTHLGSGHLQQNPFRKIHRPDGNMFAFLKAQGHQSLGDGVGTVTVLLIRPA
jgi:hypothetical protein